MASESRFLRWLIVVPSALVLAGVLPGCGSEAPDPAQPEEPEAAGGEEAGGRPVRRISKGCDPVAEAREYEDLVGERALAILSWSGMRDGASSLKIPVHVVRIDVAAVGVRFLEFPMREQYLHLWLGSGHIESAPENVFLLQPCSATLEPWPRPGSKEPTD